MKKKFLILILLFCVLSLTVFLFGCKKGEKSLTNYFMNLTYDDQNYCLSGSEKVEYVNNSENMFTSLYFHLYPNAYRQEAKNKIVSQINFDKTYPNGESYGHIEIDKVSSDEKDLEYEICGEDENILMVNLDKELFPDEQTSICIDFKVFLPEANHRLGYGENAINFGNFYPIACVYEDGVGFRQDLYSPNGDPFNSECANYEVKLSFPQKYIFVSSGEIINEKTIDGFTKINTKCQKMRDFAFVLSEKLQKSSSNYQNTKINYYGYNDEDNKKLLLACVKAVQTFSELFGQYPYKELDVVKTNFAYGGMEYPSLVMISDQIDNEKDMIYVIVHEIAHQWWYGVVGSDEYNHAWQDEGLTEFSTLLFFKENKEYDENYDELIRGALQSYKLFEKVYKNVTGSVDGRMDRPLNDFQTEPEYTQCTYTKGVLMFDGIFKSIGEKRFLRALRKYYDKYSFLIAKPEDLIACFCDVGGQGLEGYIYSWLAGKVVIQ